MQSKEIVTRLPKVKVEDMHKVCEACQLGKQTKNAFLQDRHVSKNVLEIVHSDVWGPTKTTCVWVVANTMLRSLITTQGRCGSTS